MMGKSVDELLAEVLVPEEEQPYEVPVNWVWSKLGYVAQWGSGGTPSRKNPDFFYGNIPWVKTGELNDGILYDSEEKITPEAIAKSSAKLFPKGSVLLAMYGATIGKTAILGVGATTNQACAVAIPHDKLIDKRYLLQYLKLQKNEFISQGKGGAQPNISQTIIKQYRIPVPPLREQQRIVNAIESLFAKLDKAKELISEVRAEFEQRKAAILAKAFRGELTAKWRAENGQVESAEALLQRVSADKGVVCNSMTGFYSLPPTWTWIKTGSILSYKNGISKRRGDSGSETVVLKLSDIRGRNFVSDDLRKIKLLDSEIEKYAVRKKDICIIRVNGSREIVGRAVAYDLDVPAVFCDHLIKVTPPNEGLENKYLQYVWNTALVKIQLDGRIVSSAGQNTISQGSLNEIQIPLPPYEEQIEIVNVLDKFFEEEDKIDELTTLEDHIDVMKKSILAKAFRGELGTNNPDEGSAIELLKEVLEEKVKR